MEDRDLMENMLLLEKGVCDLYLHGTIEASSPEVQQSFKTALNDSLNAQGTIYSQMKSKGWYSPDCAEQTKVDQLKQKFSV